MHAPTGSRPPLGCADFAERHRGRSLRRAFRRCVCAESDRARANAVRPYGCRAGACSRRFLFVLTFRLLGRFVNRPYRRREQPLCCSAKFYQTSAGAQCAPLRVVIRRWVVAKSDFARAGTETRPYGLVIHRWVCANFLILTGHAQSPSPTIQKRQQRNTLLSFF